MDAYLLIEFELNSMSIKVPKWGEKFSDPSREICFQDFLRKYSEMITNMAVDFKNDFCPLIIQAQI